ncbi:MAG: hydantoinase B/oxoprolinase family protein [Opitutales bacterium]|nr:hydantoinase B/oxoprolinase family protein [Opitutales bacterium]
MSRGWRIAADTGGTFTDCLGQDPDGLWHRCKVLSRSCLRARVKRWLNASEVELDADWALPENFFCGYQLEWDGDASEDPVEICGHSVKPHRLILNQPITEDLREGMQAIEIRSPEEPPVFAARFLTGTALQESLPVEDFRLATTRGTNALLENKGEPPLLIVNQGFKDICRIRDQKRPDLFALAIPDRRVLHAAVLELKGRLAADGETVEAFELHALKSQVEALDPSARRSVCVSLINAYRQPDQESRLLEYLSSLGFATAVSAAEVSNEPHYLRRTETGITNAYLSPILDRYFDRVAEPLQEGSLRIMTSAGGLVSRARYRPVDGLLSGPAGGVLGAVNAGRRAGLRQVLAFDMGGTSSDVSRWRDRYRILHRHRVGDATIAAPALAIETVAAGGGSICGYDGEKFFVGPESAGAFPGPACYGRGGPLTITDVHLLLGCLDPRGFGIPVFPERAEAVLVELMKKAGVEDREQLLAEFLQLANEKMAAAIRSVSLREGEDPSEYGLVAFGGAGGLHAVDLAEMLGVGTVVIPAEAGLLSARGLVEARPEARRERSVLQLFKEVAESLVDWVEQLEREARQQLIDEGVEASCLEAADVLLSLRLLGQESSMDVEWQPGIDIEAAFKEQYEAVFGYAPTAVDIECVRMVVAVLGPAPEQPDESFEMAEGQTAKASPQNTLTACLRGDSVSLPVYGRQSLQCGEAIRGPALFTDPWSTTILPEGWNAQIGSQGSLRLTQARVADSGHQPGASKKVEQQQLLARELFQQRCAAIVEEMGVQLERTAISANIRERLDFSCALLDAEGRLVVNAPHIPVHLGALGLCVRSVFKDRVPKPGEVWVTNHPGFGGSHLPDVTVITPFFDGDGHLVAYLANRAHHAEIGGRSPGSMPPGASSLEEEGVVIPPMRLMDSDGSCMDSLRSLLAQASYPSRNVDENIEDLNAQLAANQRGVALLRDLLRRYGAEGLQSAFADLYQFSADCMRKRIQALDLDTRRIEAQLDDGHTVRIQMSKQEDRLAFDFEGTDPQHPQNLNATPAIVRSAMLYVLRLLVAEPLPLNEGLFDPVTCKLPKCFLNPDFPEHARDCPAVVGGNVETSQILVDALIRALGLAAGSQGTMNNFLFGNERFGYYETIGGGAGAGPGFAGASGVHTHMTNTAITDAEVLERRFPVRLRTFALRSGSGGQGQTAGGDGLIRELEFLEAMEVSLLSQRRVVAPAGMQGGTSGATGAQFWIRASGEQVPLKGIDSANVQPGDRIRLETPGGGGWGKPS